MKLEIASRFASLFIALGICCAPALQAGADSDDAAPATRRGRTVLLLNAMGVRDQTGPALNRQLEKFQQLHPDVPHDFWREQYKRHVEAKLMINGMAEVIEEDFAEAEVEALLDFYQSPVGMRMVELRVRLGKIAGPLGKRLGRLFSSEIRVELEKRGYLK